MGDKFKDQIEKRINEHTAALKKLTENSDEILKLECTGCQYICMAAQEFALKAYSETLNRAMTEASILSPIIHKIVEDQSDTLNKTDKEIDELEKLFKMEGKDNKDGT